MIFISCKRGWLHNDDGAPFQGQLGVILRAHDDDVQVQNTSRRVRMGSTSCPPLKCVWATWIFSPHKGVCLGPVGFPHLRTSRYYPIATHLTSHQQFLPTLFNTNKTGALCRGYTIKSPHWMQKLAFGIESSVDLAAAAARGHPCRLPRLNLDLWGRSCC